jgi:predicted DNA-binding protein YlxM (UPF0122 family)
MTNSELQMFKPNEVSKIIEQPPAKDITPEIVQDFEVARDNIHDTIKITQKAVTECADIAEQSQGWQYYNTLASLLRASIEGNRELMEIHKKKKELHQEAPQQVTNQVILTSADMLQLIKGDKK